MPFTTKIKIFLILPFSLLLGNTAIAQQINVYFDYVLVYEFSHSSNMAEQLLIRYNSQDGIALIQWIEDGDIDENMQIIAFDDGTYLIKNDLSSAGIYQFKANNSALQVPFSDGKQMKKYLKKSERSELIAEFETTLYLGTGPDGTYRKIYILEDAFNASAIYQWFEDLGHKIPISLSEAKYLEGGQLLMRSEIFQDNVLLHKLDMLDVDHDFYRLQIPKNELPAAFLNASTAQKLDYNSMLYKQFYTMWNEYDRMSGINYQPQTYQFDRCFTYSIHMDGDQVQDLEFCFDTEQYVAWMRVYESGDATDILVFPSRQIHVYDATEKTCLVYNDQSGLPALDDLQFISASGEYFRNRYKADYTRNSADKSCYVFQDKEITENICLKQVDFDPRAMHIGLHRLLPQYPAFLNLPTPPYQLLIWLEMASSAGEKVQFELKSQTHEQRSFSDTAIEAFIKVY